MDFKGIQEKFEELYGKAPMLVRSPGRINLIGEHTDYNDGFVLPAAIDKEMIIAISENGRTNCRLYSYDFQESFETELGNLKPSETGWANYILGVVDQMQKAGYTIGGFDCVFGGNVPVGAGLSSSAALECGAAFALSQLFNLGVERTQLAKFAQKAEHEFAGVKCGIMDQFASVMGKENHALRLDCRSLDFSYFPINLQNYQIVLCDTQVKHSLASSEYNTRRQECEQGVAAVQQKHPEVKSLRDVTLPMLEEVKQAIGTVVYNRCRYVIEENERLLAGCTLLEQGNIEGFGEKMYGSHTGLSALYEVSCPELDFLVDFTKNTAAVVGSRMMGGGFGGCTINLVLKEEKEAFISQIREAYRQEFGVDMKTYEVAISNGTSQLATA
ncbi:galactokinase [Pontibacter sp. SGAir0037]|uniref:galactokinase n=1 Tax=Pontibacter sp. SGAir0037 TaxID=2571030 RepID=UPI0010CD4EBE|nr:galactokinase [Pontibacter sp. SGAir0037]QCR22228.1 galactokinase [Pontibacter sp. SGAir0037]